MSAATVACGVCGAPVGRADRFCESCGALCGVRRTAIPRVADRADGRAASCADCGNATYLDDYCTVCGRRRAENDRDQAELGGVILVTDRGLEHVRNEDAAAAGLLGAGTDRAPTVVVAVCDGVSTSPAAHTAAAAASTAGVDAMLRALTASHRPRTAVLAGLADAAKAAASAGSGLTDPAAAPCCTYVAAAVVPTAAGTVQITVGSVGDSRVYWLPEAPAAPRCLTVDDSVAQELMTAGAAAESTAVRAGAHTLTRWLGADAGPTPWSKSSVHTLTATGRGSLVMCTDGLWNHLPEATGIAELCRGSDPAAAACALVDHALRAGGQDNITVAVIPIGGLP